jgi:hypothetical protein
MDPVSMRVTTIGHLNGMGDGYYASHSNLEKIWKKDNRIWESDNTVKTQNMRGHRVVELSMDRTPG